MRKVLTSHAWSLWCNRICVSTVKYYTQLGGVFLVYRSVRIDVLNLEILLNMEINYIENINSLWLYP